MKLDTNFVRNNNELEYMEGKYFKFKFIENNKIFKRKIFDDNGYLKFNFKGNSIKLHRFLMQNELKNKSLIVHHMDENPQNNSYSNLKLMTHSEHNKYHMIKNNPMSNPIHRGKLKNRVFSEEHKQKISRAKKGMKVSEETKKKLSEMFSGEGNPNYGNTGEKCVWYGKNHTQETVSKIRNANTGKGLFGFTGAVFRKTMNGKPTKAEKVRCWKCGIKYKNRIKHLTSFEDPLSCEILYFMVILEI